MSQPQPKPKSKSKPKPDVEAGAGYLIKRVQQSLRRQCDAALRPTGLSMAQYAALRALADHPDASASELARLCFVTGSRWGICWRGCDRRVSSRTRMHPDAVAPNH